MNWVGVIVVRAIVFLSSWMMLKSSVKLLILTVYVVIYLLMKLLLSVALLRLDRRKLQNNVWNFYVCRGAREACWEAQFHGDRKVVCRGAQVVWCAEQHSPCAEGHDTLVQAVTLIYSIPSIFQSLIQLIMARCNQRNFIVSTH